METAFKTNTRTAIATQKVVDFTHMRRTGVVKLTAIGKKKKNIKGETIDDLNVSQKFFQDYRTGIYYGIPTGINELTGEYTWKRLRLFEGKVYNLTDEIDAKEWHCVQHWPIIKDSIMDTRGIAQFKVEDQDNEAEQYINDYATKRKAQDYIAELSETELLDFALAFNIDIRNNGKNVIRKMLMEMSERKTSEGKNIMWEKIQNKKELAIIIALRRARYCGLITDTVTGIVFRNTLPLGATEHQAVEFLKSNKDIFNAIEAESKSFDSSNKETKVAPLFANEAQKLAWLRSQAMELGIEKTWLKGEAELQAEIDLKRKEVAKEVTAAATKLPESPAEKKKGKKSDEEVKDDF